MRDSNSRHLRCKRSALPTELIARLFRLVASRCESRLGNSCDKRKCKNQHLASFLCFSTSTPVLRQKDQPKEKRPAEKHRLALTANRQPVSVLLTEQENTLFGRWALGHRPEPYPASRSDERRMDAPPAACTARLPYSIPAASARWTSWPSSHESMKPALKASPAPVVSITGTSFAAM